MPLALQNHDAPAGSSAAAAAVLNASAARALAQARHEPERASLRLLFAGVRFVLQGPAELLAFAACLPCCVVEPPAPVGGVDAKAGPAPHAGGGLAFSGLAFSGNVWAACHIALEPSRSRAETKAAWGMDRTLRWSWSGDTCDLETRGARAELAGVSGGCWSARASVAPRRGAIEALLNALVAALLYRQGGAVLHAASVEVCGGVVAFIGPSGAGKSTASRQAAPARLFSVDRLALVPTARGWVAHALPGGTRLAEDNEPSFAPSLPLLGVLRVRQAHEGVRFSTPAPGRKLALVRESVFQATRAPGDEAELLAGLAELCQSVAVGELFFALGAPLAALLSAWVGEQWVP